MFRATAMAARLGITPAELPLDPVDSIRAIRDLVVRGSFQRLAADTIRPPDPTLTTTDTSSGFTETDVWNPDGSFPGGTDPVSWLLGLQNPRLRRRLQPTTVVTIRVFEPSECLARGIPSPSTRMGSNTRMVRDRGPGGRVG